MKKITLMGEVHYIEKKFYGIATDENGNTYGVIWFPFGGYNPEEYDKEDACDWEYPDKILDLSSVDDVTIDCFLVNWEQAFSE